VLAPSVFLGVRWHERQLGAELMATPPARAAQDPRLAKYAAARAQQAAKTHCAGCHGAALTGDGEKGAPDLIDAEWLLGDGSVPEIERIIRAGIRSGRPGAFAPEPMPAYAGRLSPAEIEDLMAFLYSLRGIPSQAAAVQRGRALYRAEGSCVACHGPDGEGDAAKGVPNLADKVWLYGASAPDAIRKSIAAGRRGVCPGFGDTVDAVTVRALALYLNAETLRARAEAARAGM